MRVTINYTAPWGDPLCLDVDGWQLAVRRDLAERIWVQTDQD